MIRDEIGRDLLKAVNWAQGSFEEGSASNGCEAVARRRVPDTDPAVAGRPPTTREDRVQRYDTMGEG